MSRWYPQNLKCYRDLEGLTMTQAAYRCNIAPGTWSRLEHGLCQPSERVRFRILSGTGYPESFFTNPDRTSLDPRELVICRIPY